ncbi:MAG TPA: bis(5'-nucleosyl)-tetraphosphatase (symmetrical) YqeK [Candidatus Merdenecus merdavium]|nr:bis(5'-nucleosyl)-tetraphosphatase (symmetrical) YqeK [Candidatus Merdenecus merdavium]
MKFYDFEQMKTILEPTLNKERYTHTLGVMYTSAALAMRYDGSLLDAQAAGLLHDCAKCIPNDKKIILCNHYGIPVSSYEKKNPSLLHTKLGAYMAEKNYGVGSEDVKNAIRYHTTGRPNMSLLEQILYVADYIEPSRDQAPNLAQMRKLAFVDLEEALFRIMEGTISYLKKSEKEIEPTSFEAFEYYKEKRSLNKEV